MKIYRKDKTCVYGKTNMKFVSTTRKGVNFEPIQNRSLSRNPTKLRV